MSGEISAGRRMRSWTRRPRWLPVSAALLPVVPTAVFAAVPNPAAALPGLWLLLAVVAAWQLAGRLAGATALVVSVLALAFVLDRPGMANAVQRENALQLVAFVLATGAAAVLVDRVSAARQRAQANAAELDMLLESTPAGVAILDADLRFRRINAEMAEMNGRPVAAHLGRPVAEVLPAVPRQLLRYLRRVITTGVPVRDLAVELPDPRTGAVKHYLNSYFPVRGADGEVTGVGVLSLDTTQRRRLEELEREARTLRATAALAAQLETAQRIAHVGSWQWLPDGDQLGWSTEMCRIGGTATPPSTLEEGTRFVHPDDQAEMARQLEKAISSGQPVTIDQRLLRPDGTVRVTVLTMVPEFDAAGQLVALRGTSHDVTETREAERAARAAEARLAAEHQLLALLQRSLLPTGLPSLPGVALAAAYQPVTDRVDIGGDWYDAFLLPDERLALVVGDVAGHDLRAATQMGQVRNALRAFASEDPAPGSVLFRLNRLLVTSGADLVTVTYAVYDPATGLLQWSRGGHLPALLRRGSTVTMLVDPGGLVLGALPQHNHYREGEVRLGVGDLVVLFTDGLVERRDADLDQGIDALGELMRRCPDTDPDQLQDEIMSALREGPQQDDDVCVLIVQRAPVTARTGPPGQATGPGQTVPSGQPAEPGRAVPPGQPTELGQTVPAAQLDRAERDGSADWSGADVGKGRRSHAVSLTLPPDAQAPRVARAWARRQLAEWSCPDETLDNVLLVVSELVTNAVRHGAPPPTLALRHRQDDGVHWLGVEVHDDAQALPRRREAGDPLSESGRGLALVEQLALAWGVLPTGRGKTVWCELSGSFHQ